MSQLTSETSTPATPFLGDLLAWDDDGSLVVLDEADPRWRKTRKKRLSPSTANSMSYGCQARWAVEQILPRSSDPHGAAELGSAVHAVLEDLLHLPAVQRTKDRAWELLQVVHENHPELSFPDSALDLGAWRDAVAAKLTPVFTVVDPREMHVVGIERSLDQVSIDGVPLRGYIDVLELAADGGLGVTDWKSGGWKSPAKASRFGDEHGDQQRVYALGVLAHDGVMPRTARLVYTAAAKITEVDLSTKALDATRAKFTAAWEALEGIRDTGRLTVKTSGLCGYCPLALSCPTANSAKPVTPKNAAAIASLALGVGSLTSARRTTGSTDNLPETSGALQGVNLMTGNSAPVWSTAEGKSWESTGPDGLLNLNSYASIHCYGLAALATEQMMGQDQVRVTQSSISSLTLTLANVVATAQQQLVGNSSAALGVATRLRGALRTVLDFQPMPFGHGADAWAAWEANAVRRMVAIHTAAMTVWSTPQAAQAYAAQGGIADPSMLQGSQETGAPSQSAQSSVA